MKGECPRGVSLGADYAILRSSVIRASASFPWWIRTRMWPSWLALASAKAGAPAKDRGVSRFTERTLDRSRGS